MSRLKTSFEDLSRRFYEDYLGSDSASEISPQTLLLPQEFGRGGYEILKFDNTIVSRFNAHIVHDSDVLEIMPADMFCITMCIQGNYDMTFSNNWRSASNFKPGYAYLAYYACGDSCQIGFGQNSDIVALTLLLKHSQLLEYAIEFDNQAMLEKIRGCDSTEVLASTRLTASQISSTQNMYAPPYQSALRNVFLQYTHSELMLSLIESLFRPSNPQIRLTRQDMDRLEESRQIVQNSIQAPPTIAALAKQVGMNQDKLKKGFRQVYNQTIYQTVTEQRMLLAKRKIIEGDMSIAEVANEAGYENISSFIAMFRKTYGKTPGAYKRSTPVIRNAARLQ